MARRFLHRLALLSVAFGMLVAAFLLIARPWYLSWGATEGELERRLPGDEIVPGARSQQTRAITIHAPAEQVWPWVAQLGQDRAGFYSYELLEDLVGAEMTNLDGTHPALGNWRIGDKLWMAPPSKFGGMGYAVLRTLEPGRALGFATRQIGTPVGAPENGSWSFIVESAGPGSSRFLVRGRAGERGFWGTVFDRFVFEPVHFTMEKKTMTEINARAEGRGPTPIADNLEVVLWVICFGIFLAAGLFSLGAREKRNARWLWVFVAAGALLQLLPFVQPPLLLGAALVFALVALGFWAAEEPSPRRSSGRVRAARAMGQGLAIED